MKFVLYEKMNFWIVTAVFIIVFFLSFRSGLSGICDYMYGEKRVRRIKKGQSFADWLLYRRFKDVIPKFFLYSYYINSILFLLLAAASVVLKAVNVSRDIIVAVYNYYCYYIIFFGGVYLWLLFKPGTRQFDPSRWTGRPKRQSKRKKYKFKGTEK